MKRLLWVIGILAGLLLVGIAVGVLLGGGVRHATGSVVIDRPVAVVFPYLTVPYRMKLWAPELKDAEPLTEGPMGVGSRWRRVIGQGRTRNTIESEVTRFEKNNLIASRVWSDAFDGNLTFRLNEDDGRTTLQLDMAMRYKGIIPRLFSGIITRTLQRKTREDLERLKQTVEEREAFPGEEDLGA